VLGGCFVFLVEILEKLYPVLGRCLRRNENYDLRIDVAMVSEIIATLMQSCLPTMTVLYPISIMIQTEACPVKPYCWPVCRVTYLSSVPMQSFKRTQ